MFQLLLDSYDAGTMRDNTAQLDCNGFLDAAENATSTVSYKLNGMEKMYLYKLDLIFAGVYANGYRIIDVALAGGEGGGIHMDTFGDTVIATHPFQVQE